MHRRREAFHLTRVAPQVSSPALPTYQPTYLPQVSSVMANARSALVVGGGLTGTELAAELAEALGPGKVRRCCASVSPLRTATSEPTPRRRGSVALTLTDTEPLSPVGFCPAVPHLDATTT